MSKKGHRDLYPKIISMAKKGMKGTDIAAELGLSPNSVRTILFNNGELGWPPYDPEINCK